MYSEPIAYFITFTTRGSRLHGCAKGSVNRDGKYISPTPNWEQFERAERADPPFLLSEEQCEIVKNAIDSFAKKQSPIWTIHAVSVLPNHVHLVLTAKAAGIEKTATRIKAAATQKLRRIGNLPSELPPWTRDASTRYIFEQSELKAAIDYVKNQ